MFLCHLYGCHKIILNLPWPVLVSCTVWACPLTLRRVVDKFHSEASVLVSQPSDPLKEFLVQMLACHLLLLWVTLLEKTSIRKGKLAVLLSLIFLFYFFPFFFSYFCIDSNALNSVMLILNLNDYSKGVSSSEWSKGISYLCAVRTLG